MTSSRFGTPKGSEESPAEAFARSRERSAHPHFAEFRGHMEFALDDFQRRGCTALEDGHGVLLCAPTGAGKTVVGEFAVHLALAQDRKCFYTTPIKALSNQKFADLCQIYGEDTVGLLTGDTSIRPHASVVVMTTEVLRNMLYAESSAVEGLGFVVMDEVHYLADRFRGPVWEEVILHLPEFVQLASLSATVSNAEEFGEWLISVRGDTAVVVDEHRPVPLWQHMMVGNRMFDLFGGTDDQDELSIDPGLLRQTQELERRFAPGAGPNHRGPSHRGRNKPSGGRGGPGRGRGGPPPRGQKFRPPSRVEVIEHLSRQALLPAITFIFSRAGCDAALGQCVRSGLTLTDDTEAETISEVIRHYTADLPEGDLHVLGYWEWRTALLRGFAAHHAGLLPAFKQVVEELFVRGLVKAVFATETLALGINMPARSVVLEKLVKFNGETHADLTPGEYTQLTGRAGRRGIDVEGHAVVVWRPGMDPRQVAGMASTRTYPLHSSFRPGYNMTVNLVGRTGVQASRDLLEQSFAQFQADRSVGTLRRQIERNEEALAGYAASMHCELGDFTEYMRMRRQLTERERAASRRNSTEQRDLARASLRELSKGDVIEIPGGRRAGIAVVLDPGLDAGHQHEPHPLVLTEDRWAGRLAASDFTRPVTPLGRMRLPKRVEHRVPRVRRDLASALREKGFRPEGRGGGKRPATEHDSEIDVLRRSLRSHPCHGCDDREQHARWAERHAKLERETEQLRNRVSATTHSLVRSFDRIRGLLSERDYLRGEEVTTYGEWLARVYSESDLLALECLREGLWHELGAAELAAGVSALVFESRREDAPAPNVPQGRVASALQHTMRTWAALTEHERRHKLPTTREPDMGFAWPIYRWARGESLEKVLTTAEENGAELSAGDFVRWSRQVIDLLDQVRVVASRAAQDVREGAVTAVETGAPDTGAPDTGAGEPASEATPASGTTPGETELGNLAKSASAAITAIRRGVVALALT